MAGTNDKIKTKGEVAQENAAQEAAKAHLEDDKLAKVSGGGNITYVDVICPYCGDKFCVDSLLQVYECNECCAQVWRW